MKIFALVILLGLSACATPITVMQKDNDVLSCGGGTSGSLAGGRIGYLIQKSNDKDCVKNYTDQGYKVIKSE